MKIASVKKKMPSIAKPVPKTSPNRSMKCGQSRPISNERTVPVTAPTAKSTAAAFDQRFARSRAMSSPRFRPRYSAINIIAGRATPTHERMMWKPSVNAINSRAARRLSAIGNDGAKPESALTTPSVYPGSCRCQRYRLRSAYPKQALS